MALIDVIQYEESEGRLRQIYDDLISSRGKLAEVHKVQSLNPESIVAHIELYMKIMFAKSPLKRYQREMVAVVVSMQNDCPYCIRHHAEALLFFWKDEARLNDLISDYKSAYLSPTDKLLCAYAVKITKLERGTSFDGEIAKLRSAGLDDRLILDLNLVISYFNFVNRMVLALGVNLEDDGGKGYAYE